MFFGEIYYGRSCFAVHKDLRLRNELLYLASIQRDEVLPWCDYVPFRVSIGALQRKPGVVLLGGWITRWQILNHKPEVVSWAWLENSGPNTLTCSSESKGCSGTPAVGFRFVED
jgi:hypothetical protein